MFVFSWNSLKDSFYFLFKDHYHLYIFGFMVFSLCFINILKLRTYRGRIAGVQWRHTALAVTSYVFKLICTMHLSLDDYISRYCLLVFFFIGWVFCSIIYVSSPEFKDYTDWMLLVNWPARLVRSWECLPMLEAVVLSLWKTVGDPQEVWTGRWRIGNWCSVGVLRVTYELGQSNRESRIIARLEIDMVVS